MTNEDNITAASDQPSQPSQPAKRWLSATERRAVHFAEVANKQVTLKREAAERRAARQALTDTTN